MKSLIVDDNFAARRLLQIYLSELGPCFVAVNGIEAIEAVCQSIEDHEPYDLICLDIMMPELDGIEALRQIRRHEAEHGIHGLSGAKVIMTTAKDLSADIFGAFNAGCEAYVIKPIEKRKLFAEIEKLGLLSAY